MKITEFTLNKKLVSYVLTIIIIGGGILSYQKMGRLEFPTFTIKTALVITQYPGASAKEVEQEVTDLIERSAQKLSQVKEVRSISRAGLSIVYVDLKDKYITDDIPQVWDELRRKINDVQKRLPPGAGPSIVNDDFGDEYGVFFAIYGEGFSYSELKDYADLLKRELLLVPDVGNIELWGEQQEVINLEISRAKLSELGVSIDEILKTLNRQNQIVGSGKVLVEKDYIRINPTGNFTDVDELGEMLIKSRGSQTVTHLKNVVTISRGYQDPPSKVMLYNSQPAIGLGISTADGGNVVKMGRALQKRIKELEAQAPVGMEIGYIAYQSETVSESVDDFIINLIEAVIIVIVILCFAMGLSSGLLMGVILLLTIFGTFIFMEVMGISFQLISLGALILALGMLVDNAIVITEGILVKTKMGMDKTAAALETVKQAAWPLLGATFVAILAFASIGTSKDSTGEFLGSLFLVMAISLGLSWILAVTLTPLFCVKFLPEPKDDDGDEDPYKGALYRGYKKFLKLCLDNKSVTIIALILLLFLSVFAFTFVENSFFPSSRRPQFMIDYTKSEGTYIKNTEKDIKEIINYLSSLDEVSATTSFIGEGALRFLLTYSKKMPNSGFGQILVTVKDYKKIDSIIPKVRKYISENYYDADIQFSKFSLGPGGGPKIEVRFSGPDVKELRRLSKEAQKIMLKDSVATEIKDNYRQKVLVATPVVLEAKARRLGITRPQIADALAMNYTGKVVGLYREKDKLIPMLIRAPESERRSVDQMNNMIVLSPITGKSVPLGQIISRVDKVWEDPVIHRKNRKQTITASCNQNTGNASVLFERLKPQIEAIKLPPGYDREWGGEYESSGDAQKSLFKMIPIFFLAMVFTVLTLFNALRQTLIIFLCLPFSIIGVTFGLLTISEPFGFMCLLGFLGLSGMLIKNGVVLLDQIDLTIREGEAPYKAVLDSSVSRLRPVMMATITTVLGMLPLLSDPFYVGMSIVIIAGLTFGTLITLIAVPVFYTAMYKIKEI
ncbi:MAG: efflux RND transporter permease subunit [Desulfobacterales bacterium]|nr:efflux RND transporter permease subunit [Desulfobacterales bacterium]